MTDPSSQMPPPAPDLVKTEWDRIDTQDVLDYDADRELYLASFERGQEPLRETIIAVVAAVSETPPLELPPLSSTLDVDGVEQLVEATVTDPLRSDIHISFTYADYDVTVHSYGIIAAHPHHEGLAD